MKRAAAVTTVGRQRPAPSETPRRIWRVFEYRRPVPARRPRFTT